MQSRSITFHYSIICPPFCCTCHRGPQHVSDKASQGTTITDSRKASTSRTLRPSLPNQVATSNICGFTASPLVVPPNVYARKTAVPQAQTTMGQPGHLTSTGGPSSSQHLIRASIRPHSPGIATLGSAIFGDYYINLEPRMDRRISGESWWFKFPIPQTAGLGVSCLD
jgi:hypothetical protein